jgi:uncharacterized protein YqfB (UPF0267 family)
MKKIRLTEKDLNRIVKRIISEERMGDEKMVNPHHQPITIEMIKKVVMDNLMEREALLEQIPSDKLNMVVNEISENIIEDFHYKLDYMGEDLEYLIDGVDFSFLY